MHFKIVHKSDKLPTCELVYRASEFSFDVVPPIIGGFTSITIDDVSVEVDNFGKVLGIWGLCPQARWQAAELFPPTPEQGEVVFSTTVPLLRGVSLQINPNNFLPVRFDAASGWLCIGGKGIAAAALQPLRSVILEVSEFGEFCALWLRPKIIK